MTVAIFPTASWLDDPRNVWIPVEHGKKGTRVTGWDSDPPPPMSIAPGQNRALRLDHYTDLDLDCPEAVRAAEFLALTTGVYFGRPSGLTAHLLYDAPGSEPAKFKDVDNRMLVELRAGRNHYTVVPDSSLAATDGKPAETLGFFRKGEIGRVNAGGLRDSARSIATAALLGRHWPEPGSRHDVAGLAAGFLVRQKVPRRGGGGHHSSGRDHRR